MSGEQHKKSTNAQLALGTKISYENAGDWDRYSAVCSLHNVKSTHPHAPPPPPPHFFVENEGLTKNEESARGFALIFISDFGARVDAVDFYSV